MKSPDMNKARMKVKEQTDDLNPGGQLRKLLDELGSEVSQLEDDLAKLYDNQFVETVKDRPFIGALLAGAAGVAIGLYLGQRS